MPRLADEGASTPPVRFLTGVPASESKQLSIEVLEFMFLFVLLYRFCGARASACNAGGR